MTNTLLLICLLLSSGVMASHDASHPTSDDRLTEVEQLIRDAGHRVHHAWEAFHTAALGGTLASPALQMKIEENLSDARLYLTKARAAAEDQDYPKVQRLADKITQLVEQIVEDSQRRKP